MAACQLLTGIQAGSAGRCQIGTRYVVESANRAL